MQFSEKRIDIYDEFHRRPPLPFEIGQTCFHFTIQIDDHNVSDILQDLLDLCTAIEINPPLTAERQFIVHTDKLCFKWERNTEFISYTFFFPESAEEPSTTNLERIVSSDWLNNLSGPIFTATHLQILTAPNALTATPTAPDIFSVPNVAGGLVCDGLASIWSGFTLHDDGFSRMAIIDGGLGPMRAGRLAQRLLDIETYRIMALLGLNAAHWVNEKINLVELEFANLLTSQKGNETTQSNHRLLDELLDIAGRAERILSASNFRFSATQAYATLVFQRFEELNEHRLQGFQRLSNILKRRFSPAMDTCEATAKRLQDLIDRVHRDAALIRTHIDVSKQEQNSLFLDSMNRRVLLQLKLQHTVEALSGVAISYYAIAIFSILMKSLQAAGAPILPAIATGLAAPLIIIAIFFIGRQIRKSYEKLVDQGH